LFSKKVALLFDSRAVFFDVMDFGRNDTIVALATAPGTAAIAVVRVSGPKALEVSDRIYRGKRPLQEAEPWKVQRGEVIDPEGGPGEFVDQVLVTVFRGPKSYTGEDVVEFSCHGGMYVTQRVIQLLVAGGARIAQPGEFTRRAFLNGRLDLSQAEAVADLIQAKTAQALQVSGAQLQGELSRKVGQLRERLVELCSLLELELDFAEEDVQFVDAEAVRGLLEEARKEIVQLAQTYERGRILREGARAVIVGKPNVGKSSLLNALLRQDRAIVTEIPGTTRDTLEEQVDIGGVLFRVVDTAGIRSTSDPVEMEGVRRTERWLESAEAVMWVVDTSTGLNEEDAVLQSRLEQLVEQRGKKVRVLVVANKIDLVDSNSRARVFDRELNGWTVIPISATELIGFERLEKELVCSVLGSGGRAEEEIVVIDERHRTALEKAGSALWRAQETLEQGLSGEFVAVDLRAALDHLGEIIGVVGVEDILDNIFSKFCIGK
jgi:tRNA modification GTPase